MPLHKSISYRYVLAAFQRAGNFRYNFPKRKEGIYHRDLLYVAGADDLVDCRATFCLRELELWCWW